MVTSTQTPLDDLAPKISWRDVIKLDSTKFTTADYDKMVKALDEIEGTKAGQTLLSGAQMRNKELAAQTGKEDDRLVIENSDIIVKFGKGVKKGGGIFKYDVDRNVVLSSPLLLNEKKIVSFTKDETPFNETLSTALFHEITHHVDPKIIEITQEREKLLADFTIFAKEVGLGFSEHKQFFDLDKDSPFFATLSEPQQQALLELQNAAQNKETLQSDFAKLFESKKELLLANPKIKQSYDYAKKSEALLYDAELQAVRVTNEFNCEIGVPERSGYLSLIFLDRELPADKKSDILNIGTEKQTTPTPQQIDYAIYEAQTTWDKVKSDGKLTLPELRVNVPKLPDTKSPFFIPPELSEKLQGQLHAIKASAGFGFEANPTGITLANSPTLLKTNGLQV